MTIILFLIILSALIFVHELGHFLSAKKAGIRVDAFALGFPPKIYTKKVGETEYTLNLVPFGGYVKIYGEDGEDREDTEPTQKSEPSSEQVYGRARHGTDTEKDLDGADQKRRFTSKPKWVQAVVLASGVLGNVIFAWLLISIGFMAGVPSSTDGRYASEIRDPKLTITSVLPDSPAEKAGLRSGDVVSSLQEDGGAPNNRFEGYDAGAASHFIADSKGELTISYIRVGEQGTLKILPKEGIVEGKRAIGVSLDTVGKAQFGVIRSLYEGALMTADLLREVAVGLFTFLKQAVLGQASLNAMTGPIGIAGLVGEARILGVVYLLSFTAFISINLAVINLLPLPALDGGRLLFLAIEAITRRTIPVRITRFLNTAGFVLLILFMVFITYRDIVKLLQ